MIDNNSLFNIDNIRNSKEFKNIISTKSQLDYYIDNQSDPDILKIVEFSNKKFGEKTQKIVGEMLNLSKSNTSLYDLVQKSTGKKFEVKSSRYGANGKNWMWQHIMENEKFIYDYLLFIGVNFNKIDVFIITKQQLFSLKNKNVNLLNKNIKPKYIVVQQGSGEGQGLWCQYDMIKDYLNPINNIEDFNNFIENN